MKVLFISSSPNRNGNTSRVLREIKNGCEAKGCETVWHDIAYMDISGCMGCQKCRGSGVCAIEDDMTKVKEDLIAADLVVLGSPMYMASETGQTKCFIDRLYSLFQPDAEGNPGSLVPKGKRAVTVMTCRMKDGDRMYAYENTKFFKLFVNMLGFDMVLSSIVPGTGNPEDILTNHYATDSIKDAMDFISP